MILELIKEKQDLWAYLKKKPKPIVIYGMGDGADKVINLLESYDVKIAGVFASDTFVRGQSFRGFTVETLAQTEARMDDFIVLVCFATQREDVLENIYTVAAKHELYAPDVPVYGTELFDMDFLKSHEAELESVYSKLEDEISRQIFLDIISYKISGKIDYLKANVSAAEEVYSIISPGNNEIFVDAGAYNGDTIEEFLGVTGGSFEKIIALEPDRRSYKKLAAKAEGFGGDIQCLNTAAWDKKEELYFAQTSGRQNAVSASAADITQADSIDNILKGESATIIKYDVEGSEGKALAGSAETIKKYHPSLIISAYHRSGDIFSLPITALSIYSGYKLYLRRPVYIPPWDIRYVLKI